MDLRPASVVPTRATSPSDALARVLTHGAALVPDLASQTEVIAYGRTVLGERAAVVRPQFVADRKQKESYVNGHEITTADVTGRKRPAMTMHEDMPVHNDGKTFGEFSPEYILLWCERPCPEAGDSILVDGQMLLDLLSDAGYRELVEFCWTVPIDHSEAHHPQPTTSPIARVAPKGGSQVRAHGNMRALAGPNQARHQALIDQWVAFVREANAQARTFHLEAGEAALVDNYRCMHGRKAFTSPDRRLVSTWAWTHDAFAVPPVDLDFADPEAVLALT